ncbi:MAG: hypothetical protein ACQEXV_22550 [Bacillota bacterium]
MDRETKLKRVLAIANVLFSKVLDKGQKEIAFTKYMELYGREPEGAFYCLHEDLRAHAHKFGEEEMILFDLMAEIIEDNVLIRIMGVEDAAQKWKYKSPGTVKNMCATGKVKAVKKGKTWIMDVDHPNPRLTEETDDQ